MIHEEWQITEKEPIDTWNNLKTQMRGATMSYRNQESIMGLDLHKVIPF